MNSESDRRGGPAGLGGVFEKLMQDGGPMGGQFKAQVDKNAKALAQAALSKLDVVSRAEFDAQGEVLKRTRAKVDQLEKTIDELNQKLDELENS